MRNSLLLVLGLIWIHCNLMTASEESSGRAGIAMRSLEACRLEYTEMGRRAHWSGNAIYKSTINEKGEIETLTSVKTNHSIATFLKLDQFESCVKRWRFQDPGDYTILLQAGTPGAMVRISVATKGKSLTLGFP
jgi:hypothetical protein